MYMLVVLIPARWSQCLNEHPLVMHTVSLLARYMNHCISRI